ncbi:MAG: rRNA pseudouridine synthase [Ruminococcaceae bacterium]|nr:rRNA pseudouridine synthase [Oscillospiraceae bacterium]
MTERLQKILSGRGVCSRRQAEELLAAGRVTCDGVVCAVGDRADPEVSTILVDGKPLPTGASPVYIMLHKPRGYVTTLKDEKGRKNAAQLIDCGTRVYPVGRLDMDSEGLLLFTNDGDFANRMMHPKHEVDKTYQVWAEKVTDEGLEKVKLPVELDGYRIAPPTVKLLHREKNRALLEITIHEGRNRQVRRMCEKAGMYVTRLRRISEGSFTLDDLPKGKWRYLTAEEIQKCMTEL